jgi:ABC-type transport system involved in Fe-S cluster assembly fused permease/ATPase subunit
MRFHFIVCFFFVAGESFITYYTPIQFARFMDSLDLKSGVWVNFWILRALSLLGSEAGLCLPRSIMWMDVRQHRLWKLQTDAHKRIMQLDSFVHSVVSSSDQIQAVNSAKNITYAIDDICFDMMPHVFKFLFASYKLHLEYGPRMTLIMVCMTFILALTEVYMLPRQAEKFEDTRPKLYQANQRRHDGIKGWVTVDNYYQIDSETEKYAEEQGVYVGQYASTPHPSTASEALMH